MEVSLDSVLWYGSLAVLAVAVLPLDNWLPIAYIHPIIRYALGATALVVILFFMGDDDGVPGVTMETSPHVEGGVGDAADQTDESREARKEHIKEEIRRKILNDAYRDVQRASAGAVPPSTSGAGDDDDGDGDGDTSREETSRGAVGAVGAKANESQGGDSNGENKRKEEEDEDEDDLGTNKNNNNNNNTWRCACENGFLPPGLLKTFGGAEAVMRMGMGQCYHKGGA